MTVDPGWDGDLGALALPASESGMLPVEPGYKNVLRARFIILWIPIVIGALILDSILAGSLFSGLPTIAAIFLAASSIIIAPQRIYRRLRYRLEDTSLQVVRGWLFHVDTIVPLVRVQHIDVTRGPLDKAFGTASLIVHTAGTHNSTVTVPGLAPERAEEIRDTVREHVSTDLE